MLQLKYKVNYASPCPLIIAYITLSSWLCSSLMSIDSSVDKESACNAGDPGLVSVSGRSRGEGIGYPLQCSCISLVAQLVKNLPAMQETWFDPLVGKIPWRRERLPTRVFWPGEFHGLYSPWGHKDSDTTEWLSLWALLNKSEKQGCPWWSLGICNHQ